MYKKDLLKGKRILVTGVHFAEHGADLVICGRRLNVLEETANELKEKYNTDVYYQPLDIRSPQDVDDFIDNLFQSKPLDGLVNNAAGNFISPTKMLSPRGFDAIANIVFHGTFYVTHAVGKRWLENGSKGSIISILATWVWTGSPYVVPSAMSKSALHTMTKSLAVEWGGHGIKINAIAPGPFPTEGAWARLSPKGELSDESSTMDSIPMGRVGKMSELQNLATFLMADGCDYLTGQTIALDGGQYLSGGGTFSGLSKLKDSDWEEIKNMIKSTNEKDKANRQA